eukprot:scaffold167_cov244-Pinguiococcus_pyrenoidosus.AAC.8
MQREAPHVVHELKHAGPLVILEILQHRGQELLWLRARSNVFAREVPQLAGLAILMPVDAGGSPALRSGVCVLRIDVDRPAAVLLPRPPLRRRPRAGSQPLSALR